MALVVSWNPSYVLLSFAISYLGSYFGVCFSEHFRESRLRGPALFTSLQILFLLSFSIGGIGIWTMHFVGMGALVLKDDDNDSLISVKFDFMMTMLSMVVAISFIFLGSLVPTNDRVYVKNSEEFGDMLADDSKYLSIKAIRDKYRIKYLAVFKGLKLVILGGILAAGGVCIMHYLGMQAQIFPVRMEWNGGIVTASVIVAIVASIIAFWIMFRLLPLFPSSESLRVSSAIVMAIAVCGMHYTGISAPRYIKLNEVTAPMSFAVEFETAVLSSLIFGLLCLAIIIICCLCDIRKRLAISNQTVENYSDVIRRLKATGGLPSEALDILIQIDPASNGLRSNTCSYQITKQQQQQRSCSIYNAVGEGVSVSFPKYNLGGSSGSSLSSNPWPLRREGSGLGSRSWRDHRRQNSAGKSSAKIENRNYDVSQKLGCKGVNVDNTVGVDVGLSEENLSIVFDNVKPLCSGNIGGEMLETKTMEESLERSFGRLKNALPPIDEDLDSFSVIRVDSSVDQHGQ